MKQYFDHDKLKQARSFRGLSQGKASELADVPKSSISKYERGEVEPTIGNAIKLAIAYNFSMDDLFMPRDIAKMKQKKI